jgi:hypothetical protein
MRKVAIIGFSTLFLAIVITMAIPVGYAQKDPAMALQQANTQLQETILPAMNDAASQANASISNNNMVFLSAGDRFLVNTGAEQYDTANLTISDLRNGTTLGFIYISNESSASPDMVDPIPAGFYTVKAAIENGSSVRASLIGSNGTVVAYPETFIDRNIPGGTLSKGWTGSIGPGKVCIDYDFDTIVVSVCVYW